MSCCNFNNPPSPPRVLVVSPVSTPLPDFHKLLQLDPKSFANILKILGAVKIFELSQLSNRMCTLIQAANITFDHIVITFTKYSGTIEFRNNREEPHLIFDFRTVRHGALKRTLQLGRLVIPASFADHNKISCYTAYFESCVPACRQYFSNIFICRRELVSFQAYYVSGPPKLRALFEHNCFDNHLVVKLHGRLVQFDGNVFDLLPRNRELDGIVIGEINEFDLNELFSTPHVCFNETNWITRDQILNMSLTERLTRLTLMYTNLDARDVNMLIRHWIDGNWDHLQSIEICNHHKLNSNHLKKDLNILQREPIRADRCYIFQLSQLSERIRKLIRDARITFDHAAVCFSSSNASISFRNNWQDAPVLMFYFVPQTPENLAGITRPETLKFGDRKIQLINFNKKTRFNFITESFDACVEPCLQYFSEIFQCRAGLAQVRLDSRCEPPKLSNFAKYKIFNDRLTMKLTGNLSRSHTNMRNLLDDYELLDGIIINLPIDTTKFNLNEMFTLRNVCLMNANWVTREFLQSVNFTRLTLTNTNLTALDVNAFIQQWILGKCSHLKRLEILNNVAFNADNLKINLHLQPWNRRNRNQYYIMDNQFKPYLLDLKDGGDLESDGQLATLFHSDKKILFVVWNPRHFDLPMLRKSEYFFDPFH